MKTWPKVNVMLAGIALIGATNGVALVGVAWNRAGTPDSQLQLSQRELHSPYRWQVRDNSGIALTLAWRVPVRDGKKGREGDYDTDYGGSGTPWWLDAEKMRRLGFTVQEVTASDDTWQARRERSREVLLVLEFNGPDTQRALEQAQHKAVEADALLAANPDKQEFRDRARRAHERVKEENEERSRLFAVDAGTDLASLRAQYPDRSRFVIVRGKVRVWGYGPRRAEEPQGHIYGVINNTINVPLEFRPLFEREGNPVTRGRATSTAPFQATVAFGQRLEPWLVAVAQATP